MGKKDKKKVSGAVKTAAKTEKKLESKRKKEIANIGEEDIESIVAGIEKEEAKRLAVVETVIAPPSARVSASFVPHPTNTSELILFGGEHHDGKKTFVYNGLYVYNTAKAEWRVIKAPGAPPPRSAHQAVALPSNKGELWVFGGEFTSPSEMQFYHYKDLWVFNLADRKWEKVDRPGAPSPRSGHRMCALKRTLIVFGGYNDNGRVYKYLGDMHVFCTDSRLWTRVQGAGMGPCARSACLLMPVAPDNLIVYGGYSRVREGKTDHGVTHGDLFRLAPVPPKPSLEAPTAPTYRWEALKGGPSRPQPARSSFSTCLAPGNKAYVFGGVQDTEETEEMLLGEMFDSLHCLELDTGLWRSVAMRLQKLPKQAVQQEETPTTADDGDDMETDAANPVTVCTDGVFTMTVAAPSKPSLSGGTSSGSRDPSEQGGPSPRMNAMMAVQKSTLYLYGGLVEKGDKQFTLSDMYSLDLHKLDGWKTIMTQTGLPEWLGSDSESDGDDESGSDGSDSQSESD